MDNRFQLSTANLDKQNCSFFRSKILDTVSFYNPMKIIIVLGQQIRKHVNKIYTYSIIHGQMSPPFQVEAKV